MIQYGLLHNHTQNSIKDSTMRVERLCERARELGAPAVAISDHGVLTGIPGFVKAAKKEGIKPIAGVEYYVKENPEDIRLHLCVYAKDRIGYQAMMKAVKLSNKRIEKTGTLIFPCCNEEILQSCFGPGSEGYGHVIATSACIGGVLGGLHFQNEHYKEEIQKYTRTTEKFSGVLELMEGYQKNVDEISKQIELLVPVAERKFGELKREIKKTANEAEKAAKEAGLQKMVSESEQARQEISKLKTTRSTISKQITLCKNKLPKEDSAAGNYAAKLLALQEKALSREELISLMESEAIRYQALFGQGDFYIELQFHGHPAEKEYMFVLDNIAQKLGIPTVAANDAHMAGNTKEDILARETINSMRFTKLEAMDPCDYELYLKNDGELYEAINKVVAPDRALTAMKNVGRIVAACNYEPEENPKHYPVFDKNVNAFELLKEMAYSRIPLRFPNGFPTAEYQERLEYELEVIHRLNVSDYHLIVQDLLNFTKKLGKMPEERYAYLEGHIWDMAYDEIVAFVEADQSNIGYVVGPGRGSSAGSLVCFLLGITDLDPIEHSLLFERYLNPERVTMPDIDSDYANGYRDLTVVYTYKRYGMDAVCRIITYGTYAAKSAIEDSAKAIGNGKNRLEEYVKLGDMLKAVIPNKPHAMIQESREAFEEYAKNDPRVTEVIERALSIEGAYKQYGMHAAGVIISDNDNVNEYVPLSWDEKNKQWKCQVDMAEAEEQGLLKMDYLGLKNLNIITEILRLIYKRTGLKINPNEDIQEEANVIRAICASGRTNGIFQLESDGIKDVEKRLKPDKFEDLILLLAAYRPGPMDSIPSMIAVKNGKNPEYRHPLLEPILKVTYGSLIYQEQVQQIFRSLAGYSFGRADTVRRAMSKKKEQVFLAEKPVFIYGKAEEGIQGCVANGIPAETAEAIFDDMVDFAKYAFNKSHAAAYARVTYILAWLKYYYPKEFMAVLLQHANTVQLISLVAECKENGIEILPVDINRSDSRFLLADNKIFFGLTAIKGIGAVEPILAARREAPFTDFQDFFLRGHFKKDITEKLIKAGAFDNLCKNRKALLMAFEEMVVISENRKTPLKNIAQDKAILEVLRKLQQEGGKLSNTEILAKLKAAGYKNKTVPSMEKIEKKLAEDIKKDAEILAQLKEIEVPSYIDEDIQEKLRYEKEMIGVYLSGHPMDAYKTDSHISSICNLKEGQTVSAAGIISDFAIRKKKATGEDMGFFNLEDQTGIIQVTCFTKAYREFGELLSEGKVVEIKGKVMAEEIYTAENAEEEEDDAKETSVTLKLNVYSVKELQPASKMLVLRIRNILEWNSIFRKDIAPFVSTEGKYRLILQDTLFNEVRETGLRVNARILNKETLRNDMTLV